MAMLDDLGAKLAALGLASSSGAGNFVLVKSWLPDSCQLQDRAVALIEYGGEAPNPRAELDSPRVQVLVRGARLTQVSSAYREARDKAESIKLALHGLTTTSSSGRYYPGVLALQDPFLREYDAVRRPVIVCNYKVWRSRT